MAEAAAGQTGILGWVERTGNRLPDPVFIFFYLIIALVVISIACAALGVGAFHPTQLDEATGDPLRIEAVSLLAAENIQRLWVEMPKTFTHFHPLGYVLVVMLGAGVAERSGFFAAGMAKAVKSAPVSLLTPVVALVAMLGNHAADAGYVVLIPLAGILFAAAGRHPLAGIAAAFAGVRAASRPISRRASSTHCCSALLRKRWARARSTQAGPPISRATGTSSPR